MRRLLLYAIVAGLAWYGWGKYHEQAAAITEDSSLVETADAGELDSSRFTSPERSSEASPGAFTCDGRTYCSQMTSCEEATYFIRNCPGTKMDGNNDGVPCESQWCK
jgi:Excalibur calcium-binding domain